MTLFQKLVWPSSFPFKIKFTSLKKAGLFKPSSCRKSVTSWSQFSIHSGRSSWLCKIPLLLSHGVWRMRGCHFHPKCMKISARNWRKEKLVKFISNTLQVTHIGIAPIKQKIKSMSCHTIFHPIILCSNYQTNHRFCAGHT